jgi:glycine cleavage system H protein
MSLDANTTRFAATHEWARKEGGELVIGISDHAQHSLGDIVYVDLPKPGAVFKAGAVFGVVESVKAASDIYLPVGGKIAAVNEALAERPELINRDCYGEGWIARMVPEDPSAWEGLLSAGEYGKIAAGGD